MPDEQSPDNIQPSAEMHDTEPANDESAITNEEPKTQNIKSETENMEVHHHLDLHHKRKNFCLTEYQF